MTSLRDMRRRRALSRSELAKRVGVTPQSIGHYENGKRVPKYPIAQRLGRELAVPWSQIVDTAHRAWQRRRDAEAEVADLRERLREAVDQGDDELRAALAEVAADVLDVEVRR